MGVSGVSISTAWPSPRLATTAPRAARRWQPLFRLLRLATVTALSGIAVFTLGWSEAVTMTLAIARFLLLVLVVIALGATTLSLTVVRSARHRRTTDNAPT